MPRMVGKIWHAKCSAEGQPPRAPDKCCYCCSEEKAMWLCGKPFAALNLSFSICRTCHPFVASQCCL